MASEDDELDEIEEELARVEEEIQDLEEDLDEPEAPDPEDPDVEAPEPERALDDDADIEPDPSLVDKVKDRLGSEEADDEPSEADEETETDDEGGVLGGLIGSEEDEEPEEEADEAEDEPPEPEEPDEEAEALAEQDEELEPEEEPSSEPEDEALESDEEPEEPPEDETEEEDDDGFLGGLIGSDDSDEEADEPQETDEETDEGDDDGFLGGLIASDDEDEQDDGDEQDPAEADATAEDQEADEDDENGFLGGLIGSGDEDDEDEAPEPEEAEGGGSDEEAEAASASPAESEDEALEADDSSASPSEDDAVEPGDEPDEADDAETEDEAEDDEDGPRASALLARFQDHEEPVEHPHEAEEDDNRGIIVGAVIVLLFLIGAAVGAFYLTQGSGGTSTLSAELAANTVTGEDGGFIATTGQAVEFDARASNGSAEEYQWDFGDGNQETTSAPTVEHTYQSAGTYTVEVTLATGSSTDSTTLEIQVIQAPEAQAAVLLGEEPVAEPGQTGNNVFVGDEVTLDGSASSADPDHRLTSYTWDVNGDGEPEATGSSAQVSFDEPGRWLVALGVTDDLGNEATDERPVHVSNRRAQTATIGPSTTESDTDVYNVSVTPARLDARPVQLDLRLTYNSSSNDTAGLPVQPTVDSDLDLNVTDPEGTVYQADDDAGQGNETLTVSGGDLAPLGEWTVAVSQDTTEGASGQEVDYRVVIETIY